ncbi:hypothetical protein [Rhodohalobacter mucosus]|uniref:Uncharacterized protein n=1 Tax=Rhodohalobacter mucosus TaxID=2079485 RepID=A0A316TRN1_9BACT|nr:hypothetical protein [Rhodohalobacter mucosus]PWN07227.1 hypothetical protein DDZ15_05355 [Rhodohalobacter mucosus]
MGFVKRNIEMEGYLDSLNTEWRLLSDSEYRHMLQSLNSFMDQGAFSLFEGERAYAAFVERLPLYGYLFSAPEHEYFSANESGGSAVTFGYEIRNLSGVDRERINSIECVISDSEMSFCAAFHHEWESLVPEQFFDLHTGSEN